VKVEAATTGKMAKNTGFTRTALLHAGHILTEITPPQVNEYIKRRVLDYKLQNLGSPT
jgi:hypothetical protein